ncbi:hypothetical protein V8E54_006305 [Elaphomyces granulatus]|jgi:hypothetical protein
MPRWTKTKVISHLQLTTDEFEQCRDFLEDLLSESGLLGEDFRKSPGTQRIEDLLAETLQITDHNKVPTPILHASASSHGMRGLVGFSLIINNDYRRRQSEDANLLLSLSVPSVQAPHRTPLLENCTIVVDNLVYQDFNSVRAVTQVLKDGASQPITHRDLDFCRWKDILCEECGFDESYHLLAYSLPDTPAPYHFVVQNECSWQSAILNMANAGLTRCVFRMEFLGQRQCVDTVANSG